MNFLRHKLLLYPSIAGTLVAGFSLLKDCLAGSLFDRTIKADGKVVIITGANSGIGAQAALDLARRGATVYMACRDLQKCEKEREDIVLSTKNKYVYCRQCDLASFESIRKFVDIFKSEQTKLDILINNAGVMRCPKSVTKEGIEMQLGVNHMGHFLLTNLLLDILKKSAPSRVVIVSSRAHAKGKINVEDLNSENNYNAGNAYNQSKLANMLFGYELANKLIDSNVAVNLVHPGIVDTNIVRHLPIASGITGYMFYPFFWPFVKDPVYGAQPVLYVALEPDIAGITGKYFIDMKITEPSEDALNADLSKWLWEVSEKWTRLDKTQIKLQ